jgi:hypothetical protein
MPLTTFIVLITAGRIVFLLLLLLIIPLAFIAQYNRVRTTWNYFEKIASALGTQLSRPKIDYFNPPLPAFQSRHKEIDFRIRTEKRGGGKITIYFTIAEATLQAAPGFEFRLQKQGLIQKAFATFKGQDVQPGHAEFDKLFLLKSTDVEKARQLFTPDLCNALVEQHANLYGGFWLRENVLNWEAEFLVNSQERFDKVIAAVNAEVLIVEELQRKSLV